MQFTTKKAARIHLTDMGRKHAAAFIRRALAAGMWYYKRDGERGQYIGIGACYIDPDTGRPHFSSYWPGTAEADAPARERKALEEFAGVSAVDLIRRAIGFDLERRAIKTEGGGMERTHQAWSTLVFFASPELTPEEIAAAETLYKQNAF